MDTGTFTIYSHLYVSYVISLKKNQRKQQQQTVGIYGSFGKQSNAHPDIHTLPVFSGTGGENRIRFMGQYKDRVHLTITIIDKTGSTREN